MKYSDFCCYYLSKRTVILEKVKGGEGRRERMQIKLLGNLKATYAE